MHEVAAGSDLHRPIEQLDEAHLRLLIRASHEFNSTLDLELLLPRTLDALLATLDAESGSIWLVDGSTLRCRFARGPAADRITGLELPLGAGIVGDVVVRGTPALVDDARADERFLPQVDAATGYETRSLLAVPLVARGGRLGAIQVLNPRGGGGFSTSDLHFLEALADDAAAAILNAQAFDAERRARDLKALLEISHEMTSTLDLDRVLVSIVNLAGRAVQFDRCVLALRAGDELAIRAISGETTVDRKAAAVRELERFLAWAAERGEEIFIPDLDDVSDVTAVQLRTSFAGYRAESGARAVLVRHVADGAGEFGVLLFEFSRPHPLTEWEREAIQLLEDEAALALRNAQLYAGVPFISFLEPLAERRRALAAIPGATWLRYGAVAVAALLILVLVRLPLRVGAAEVTTRAAVQLPARATIDGIVETVRVREGDRVAAGAPLLRIRNERLLHDLREAEGGLERSRRESLAAEAAGDGVRAVLTRVRTAELSDLSALIRQQLGQAEVVAPADGIVLTPHLTELVGSHVPAGAVVAWVGHPDRIEIELKVPQHDIGVVRPGDRVRARVSAYPGTTFTGDVVAIAPRAELVAGAPTYTVRALLDNPDGLLRPGMSAHARVHTSSRPLGEILLRRPWRWLRLNVWW
jgi:GAF domain-containing protein/multidrug efflux pump subunit AcrA (membrane-fusion protein)